MKSFNDLAGLFSADDHPLNTLRLTTIRRSYLRPDDAGYDWVAGVEFRVCYSNDSPLDGMKVSILDRRDLVQYGYTTVEIAYNDGVQPLSINL